MQIKRKVIHRSNEPKVSNDKGYFATPLALTTAYPVWQNGWYAIVWTTDTVWIWDWDTTSWKDSWIQGGAFWQRTWTTISPTTAGDNIETSWTLNITNTTDSTSSTTWAIKTSWWLWVAKALYVWTDLDTLYFKYLNTTTWWTNSLKIWPSAGALWNGANDSVAIWWNSMSKQVSWDRVVAIWSSAWFNYTWNDSIFIWHASWFLTTTWQFITAIWKDAGRSHNGNNCSFIWYRAWYWNSGTWGWNTWISSYALYSLTSWIQNMWLWLNAWYKITTWSNNFVFWTNAGYNTVDWSDNYFIWTESWFTNISWSRNVFMWRDSWRFNTSSGSVFIWYRAGRDETTWDKLYIHNSESANPLIYWEFDNKLIKFNNAEDKALLAISPTWNTALAIATVWYVDSKLNLDNVITDTIEVNVISWSSSNYIRTCTIDNDWNLITI
jgi:hypothetical protein